ncbi:MAG: hypothetical protein ACTHJW_19200 [Streptosporangiaceae bacterium]
MRIEPGVPNSHAAWRMDLARRIAAAYRPDAPIVALTVAGSVGAGLADPYSDLELDCYWLEPPSDEDRRHPVEAVGGRMTGFWDYDADDAEWSEDYRLGDLGVTLSNFTVGTVESFLDDVTLRADTSAIKHMRLAAILRCRPLAGESVVDGWRLRAARYPDQLAAAMVRQALTPEVLAGWAGRDALVSRCDDAALHALLSRVECAVLEAVLAVNRVYRPHRFLKWQRALLADLAHGPRDLTARLQRLWVDPGHEAVDEAEVLLLEVANLATDSTGADLADFLSALGERRPVLEPPVGSLGLRAGPLID